MIGSDVIQLVELFRVVRPLASYEQDCRVEGIIERSANLRYFCDTISGRSVYRRCS
jgi:hypothetical protein